MRGLLIVLAMGVLAGCAHSAEPLTSDAAVNPCKSHLPRAVKNVRTTVAAVDRQRWRANFWLADYQTGNQRPVGDPDFVCVARPDNRKVRVESFGRAPHDPRSALKPDPRLNQGSPRERPRPTDNDVLAAAGESVDVDGYREVADAQKAAHVRSADRTVTVGMIGGRPAYDYVWGDVYDWEVGQGFFAPDAVVLRLVRCTDAALRLFQVVAFDVTTGRHAPAYENGGGERPVTWTYDEPSTAWAE